jgi:hypothetical protein
MDVIISKLEARSKISTRQYLQIQAYADDNITGRTEQPMLDMFTKPKNKASK